MYKKRYFIFALMTCAALGASNTHARANDDDGHGQMNTISWDDFKFRCSDAKDKPLNQQLKPAHIRLQCTNVEREYVPSDPGVLDLGASRHVLTTVLSDKFDVAVMGKDYAPSGAAAKAAGTCLRYKEVERTIQVEKTLSCGEVVGIKGDINDYCAGALEMAKGTSPKLIETRETGAVRDTCGGGGGGGWR